MLHPHIVPPEEAAVPADVGDGKLPAHGSQVTALRAEAVQSDAVGGVGSCVFELRPVLCLETMICIS